MRYRESKIDIHIPCLESTAVPRRISTGAFVVREDFLCKVEGLKIGEEKNANEPLS